MPTYDRIPSIDENNNFPSPVLTALVKTNTFKSGVNSEVRSDIDAVKKAQSDYSTATNREFSAVNREISAIKGSQEGALDLITNLSTDPKPFRPGVSFNAFRCETSVVLGYARCTSTIEGATYIQPNYMTNVLTDERVNFPGKSGDIATMRMEVRGHPTEEMGVQLILRACTWDDATSSFTNFENISSTPLTFIEPGSSIVCEVQEKLPSGATHFTAQLQFRRRGLSYPVIGDYIDVRRIAAFSGDLEIGEQITWFDGDSLGAYWLGHANRSVSQISGLSMTVSDLKISSSKREAIVDAGLRRRGRVIGTGGKAAVALRFDHHYSQFNSKVIPLLKKYRLPWGQMTNIGNFGAGNDTLTTAQVRDLVLTTGGELWNHGYSHSNIDNKEDANREVLKGLSDLKAAFPEVYIDGFAVAGQPRLFGMESDTPEGLYDSYPGKLVLENHAFVRGYYPGIYDLLTGANLIGQAHVTIDAQTPSWINGVVRGAVDDKAGATLMLHPNYLDTTGYLSTSDLEVVLSNIASLRDAGELMVVSPTGLLLADKNQPVNNLVSFPAGSVDTTVTKNLSYRVYQPQLGVPHEAVVSVIARSAGTVKLTITVDHPGTTVIAPNHVVTLAKNASTDLRVVVTPPLTTTGIKITLTGDVHHSDVSFHAV